MQTHSAVCNTRGSFINSITHAADAVARFRLLGCSRPENLSGCFISPGDWPIIAELARGRWAITMHWCRAYASAAALLAAPEGQRISHFIMSEEGGQQNKK